MDAISFGKHFYNVIHFVLIGSNLHWVMGMNHIYLLPKLCNQYLYGVRLFGVVETLLSVGGGGLGGGGGGAGAAEGDDEDDGEGDDDEVDGVQPRVPVRVVQYAAEQVGVA